MLSTRPKYFRAPKAKGSAPRVEREGGYAGAGLIRGVSVITRGEALGHELWIDEQFLEQTVEAINANEKGVKARFTHPDMSGDALGTFVGRVVNARRLGDQVLGDLHLSQAATKAPDGNLADYLLTLAETDPESFGLSIVFSEDVEAMAAFHAIHDETPDEDNVNNYAHARLDRLFAVDAVDEPAANPGGLFHRGNPVFDDAEAVAKFALGLSAKRPTLHALSLDPERVRGFVARFLKTNNLEVKKMPLSKYDDKLDALEERRTDEVVDVKGVTEDDEIVDVDALIAEMENDDAEVDSANDTTGEAEAAAYTAAEDETPEPVADDAPADAAPEPIAAKSGADFLERFGTDGAVWFALGKTWDEARDLFAAKLEADNAKLQAEIEALKKKLAIAAKFGGEDEPASFKPEVKPDARRGPESKIRIAGQY